MSRSGKWRRRLLYRLYRPFEQSLLRRAQAILVTSPPYLTSSAALTPWCHKCGVILLGINTPGTKPTRSTADPGAGRPLQVLADGRLSYYKDFDLLRRAIGATPHISLDLLGNGEERPRLRSHVSDTERTARLVACDYLRQPSIQRCAMETLGIYRQLVGR